mmetsp:Transcript_169000/g.410721  ORF Transcript_169000/g.410721 Transcript_169000/m.410721 type:complete len:229 (+) Transcript_169000:54-740(+)
MLTFLTVLSAVQSGLLLDKNSRRKNLHSLYAARFRCHANFMVHAWLCGLRAGAGPSDVQRRVRCSVLGSHKAHSRASRVEGSVVLLQDGLAENDGPGAHGRWQVDVHQHGYTATRGLNPPLQCLDLRPREVRRLEHHREVPQVHLELWAGSAAATAWACRVPQEVGQLRTKLAWHTQQRRASVYNGPAISIRAEVQFLASSRNSMNLKLPVAVLGIQHCAPGEVTCPI